MPEEYLGQTVTDAVITVPAYFNDAKPEKQLKKRNNCRIKRIKNYQWANSCVISLWFR